VSHLDDGTLRRIQDEPLALSAAAEQHLDACDACQARARAIAAQASEVGRLLSLPHFDPAAAAALGRFRAAAPPAPAGSGIAIARRSLTGLSWRRPRAVRAGAVLALTAILLVGLTVTGVSGQLKTVFAPTHVTPVAVSRGDLRKAGRPLDYGTLTWNPAPPQIAVADAATAASRSSLPLLTPGYLPAGVPSTVTYGYMTAATASFRFDGAKLQASAAQAGQHVAPMPAAIDGSVLYVNAGPALVMAYGHVPPANAAEQSAATPMSELPVLAIVETRAPTVSSSGASASQLEGYLLSQPGVPADLAAELRAIKDPTSTLPIPVPSGMASGKAVTVQGVPGVLIDAGLVTGVVWERKGVIYAVGGQLTAVQTLQVANSIS
jgi:hypothetical protein